MRKPYTIKSPEAFRIQHSKAAKKRWAKVTKEQRAALTEAAREAAIKRWELKRKEAVDAEYFSGSVTISD